MSNTEFYIWLTGEENNLSPASAKKYDNLVHGTDSDLIKWSREHGLCPQDAVLAQLELNRLFRISQESVGEINSSSRSALSKYMDYKLALAEKDSPSALEEGDRISLYGVLRKFFVNRLDREDDAYFLLYNAVMLSDIAPNKHELENLHVKGKKYPLYRQVILKNWALRRQDVVSALEQALLKLGGDAENMCRLVESTAKDLRNSFDFEDFSGSGTEQTILTLLSVTGDWYEKSAAKAQIKMYSKNELRRIAELVGSLIVQGAMCQGNSFAPRECERAQTPDEARLMAVLAPFSGSLTVELMSEAELMGNPSVMKLIQMGLITAVKPKGSRKTFLKTSGNPENSLPSNSDAVSMLKPVWQDEKTAQVLSSLARALRRMQNRELSLLALSQKGMAERNELSRELYVLPQDLVTLLASAPVGECAAADELAKAIAVGHWINVWVLPGPTQERFDSALRLSELYRQRPDAVTQGIRELPDLYEKDSGTLDIRLAQNSRGESRFLGEILLALANDAMSLVYEESDLSAVSEYRLTCAAKAAREAMNISLAFEQQERAFESGCLLAEAWITFAKQKAQTGENARLILEDAVLPCIEAIRGCANNAHDMDMCMRSVFDDIYAQCDSDLFDELSPVRKCFERDGIWSIVPHSLDDSAWENVRELLELNRVPHSLRDSLEPWIPHRVEKNDFFRPFYLADLDSELAQRKGFKEEDTQPLIMKTLLSGQLIITTTNQLVDNVQLRSMAHNAGFLNLLRRGFFVLSLYGDFYGLAHYAAAQMDKDFTWSSLKWLNYRQGKNCENINREVKALRAQARDYLRGEISAQQLSQEHRNGIIRFKEELDLIDEHMPAASKLYYYQRNTRSVPNLTERMAHFYSEKADVPELDRMRKAHNVIEKILLSDAAAYNRSQYQTVLDGIRNGELSGITAPTELLSELERISPDETELKLMQEVLTDRQNAFLGSLVSPYRHHTYRSDEELIMPYRDTLQDKPYSPSAGSMYRDTLRITETGESVDWESMHLRLYELERRINEAPADITSDRLANKLDNEALSYGVDAAGKIRLQRAQLRISNNRKMRVENCRDKSDNSIAHLETSEQTGGKAK